MTLINPLSFVSTACLLRDKSAELPSQMAPRLQFAISCIFPFSIFIRQQLAAYVLSTLCHWAVPGQFQSESSVAGQIEYTR